MSIHSDARLLALRTVEQSYQHHNTKESLCTMLSEFWSMWDTSEDDALPFLDYIGSTFGSYVAQLAYEAA